jgi:hypothetical protein
VKEQISSLTEFIKRGFLLDDARLKEPKKHEDKLVLSQHPEEKI